MAERGNMLTVTSKPLRSRAFARPAAWLAASLLCTALSFAAAPAFALSEIPEEDVPAEPEITTVPLPDPLANPGNESPAGAAPADLIWSAKVPSGRARDRQPLYSETGQGAIFVRDIAHGIGGQRSESATQIGCEA